MVQWLRACCTLAEDPSLVLSTLISAHSCLQLQLQKVPTSLTHAGTYTHLYTPSHIYTHNTYRHDLKNKKLRIFKNSTLNLNKQIATI